MTYSHSILGLALPSHYPKQRRTVRCKAQSSDISRREVLIGGLSGAALTLASPASNATDNVSQETYLPPIPSASICRKLEVSQVIKGCWQLSGGHRGDKSTDRTAGDPAIRDFFKFVDAGEYTFDTADHYGPSEKLIGRFLERWRESGGADDAVRVLTKVCVFSPADMLLASRSDYVEQAVDRSLQRLGVNCIDMVQFYWGDYGVGSYVDVALRLQELQAKGKVKTIGVTNFDVTSLQEMVDAGVDIVSNQVQYSLLDRRPENYMTAFCGQRDIKLLPYGVAAGGLLSSRYLGVPVDQVTADTYSKRKYGSVIYQAFGGWEPFQALLQVLDGIAKKHNTSITNIAARWVLQKPQVPAIILGARNANHLPDHRQIFTFTLDDDDLQQIQEILSTVKKPRSDCYTWERGGEF